MPQFHATVSISAAHLFLVQRSNRAPLLIKLQVMFTCECVQAFDLAPKSRSCHGPEQRLMANLRWRLLWSHKYTLSAEKGSTHNTQGSQCNRSVGEFCGCKGSGFVDHTSPPLPRNGTERRSKLSVGDRRRVPARARDYHFAKRANFPPLARGTEPCTSPHNELDGHRQGRTPVHSIKRAHSNKSKHFTIHHTVRGFTPFSSLAGTVPSPAGSVLTLQRSRTAARASEPYHKAHHLFNRTLWLQSLE